MKLLPGALPLAQTGFQVLMLGRRLQSLTPMEYRDHYENVHIPLMKNLTGDSFPLSHVRHYVSRSHDPDAEDGGLTWPANLFMGGDQADFDFDAVAVLTWRDKKHFEDNMAFFEDPDTAKIIAEDEAKFSEWVKGVYLQ